MNVRITPNSLHGTVSAISSKSDVHRLVIAAALADKKTAIRCNTRSADIEATVRCMNSLGAAICFRENEIIVEPISVLPSKASLDCGESGSTLRFLLPVAAALGITAEFCGAGRLPSRPITPLRREMEANGITFSPPWVFPVKISGRLEPNEYVMKGDVSSQFITGLLFALPMLPGDSTIRIIPPLQSKPYVDLTLSTLKKFGIEIETDGNIYRIKGNQRFVSPGEITAEGDWSNAAFFLTAGALSGQITVEGLDIHSIQGDRRVIDILASMGAEITVIGDRVTAEKSDLHGVVIDAGDIPDLIPILSVAAAGAKSGMTTVTNAERLRLKESDRLAAICECLNNVGTVVAQMDDGLVIWTGDSVRGGNVFGFNDHRIVMSMAIASTITQNDVIIRGAEAVEKSYPQFFEDFKALGGIVDVLDD